MKKAVPIVLSIGLLLFGFDRATLFTGTSRSMADELTPAPPKLPAFLWTGTFMFSQERGRVRVLTNDLERYGYIDPQGKMVIPAKYLANGNFAQGLAPVKFTTQKYGFIDRSGQTIISPKFDDAYGFIDGRSVVRVGNKMGAIDRQGKFTVKPIYSNTALEFQSGLLAVEKDKLWGFVDAQGQMVIAPQFKLSPPDKDEDDTRDLGDFYLMRFTEGLAAVSRDGANYGYIDPQGRMVIPPQFKYARAFSEGLGLVKTKDGKWGYIDRLGKMVILLPAADRFTIAEAAFLSNFSEGLAGVKIGKKWGFIDRTGKQVIPAQFDGIYPFSEGLAGVLINGKYGFIDCTGKQVISPQFDLAFSFKEGLAPVVIGEYGTVNARVGYIDKQGKLVIAQPVERVKKNDPLRGR